MIKFNQSIGMLTLLAVSAMTSLSAADPYFPAGGWHPQRDYAQPSAYGYGYPPRQQWHGSPAPFGWQPPLPQTPQQSYSAPASPSATYHRSPPVRSSGQRKKTGETIYKSKLTCIEEQREEEGIAHLACSKAIPTVTAASMRGDLHEEESLLVFPDEVYLRGALEAKKNEIRQLAKTRAISQGEAAKIIADRDTIIAAIDTDPVPHFLIDGTYGSEPLIIAGEQQNFVFAHRLIRAGINPNLQGLTGKTPLTIACRSGDIRMIELLLTADKKSRVPDKKYKTDPNLADADGITPVQHAMYYSRTTNPCKNCAAVIALLFDYGAIIPDDIFAFAKETILETI